MKPIVTPAWVDTTIAKKRLAHVRPFTPDPQFFFSGVIATVAELPVGDKEAICGGIIAMGGQYNGNLTKFTTHLVALNMDNVCKCYSLPLTPDDLLEGPLTPRKRKNVNP